MNSPSVSRSVLRILAGIVWSTVGLGLCAAAVYWLTTTPGNRLLPTIVGVIAGVIVYYFGFRKLVIKNKARIYEQAQGKDKVCLFAFQSWKSYLIIVVMVILGYVVRHLPVSRLYIAPIYLTIGIGLLLASLHYYTAIDNPSPQ